MALHLAQAASSILEPIVLGPAGFSAIKELISQINLLKDRVIHLEETFLSIPEDHEILYEKVYVKNPMKQFPYVIEILDNPSSKDVETS